MSKPKQETTSKATQPPLNFQVPAAYADNIAGVSIGPFVSKILFGMDGTPNHPPIATLQVAIPTNVLHALASQVISIMRGQDVQEQFSSAHSTLQSSLTE